MHRSNPDEADEVRRARRWLVLAKLVATTLAALVTAAKALGWV